MPNWNQKKVQKAFVEFVRRFKDEYSVSYQKLSDKSGVHKDTIRNLLMGKTIPVDNTRKKLFEGIAKIKNQYEANPADKKHTWLTVQAEFEASLVPRNQRPNQNVSSPDTAETPQKESETYGSEFSYEGLSGLLPDFYYGLRLGHRTQRTSNQYIGNPIEFPINERKESSDYPRYREFDTEPEEALFKVWIKTSGVYLVLGEPGGGKTTLLRQWRQRSKYHVAITDVVWFPFREQSLKDIKSLEKIKTGSPLFLFDGWDEAENKVKYAFKDLLSRLPGIKIISCRTAVYNSDFDHTLTLNKPYYLLGLRPEEQQAFLEHLAEKWGNCTDVKLERFRQTDERWANRLYDMIHSHARISHLSGSPLLLTLIAYIYPPPLTDSNRLPANRFAFYQKAFTWLCTNRIDDEKYITFIDDALAFLLMLVNKIGLHPIVPRDIVLSVYKTYREKDPDSLSFERFIPLLTGAGIIHYNRLGEKYEFLHLTFVEWFLAKALYQQQGLFDSVEQYWLNSKYDEVLSLMWSFEDVKSEERIQATNYLIDTGCVDTSTDKRSTLSGLQTVLKWWAESGIAIEKEYAGLYKVLHSLLLKSNDRKQIATRLDLPNIFYERLAGDVDAGVRQGVADNANTPVEVLERLASDVDAEVRLHVATNANTPVEVLARLASDVDAGVRWRVAFDVNMPVEVLERLASDVDAGVRWRVATNANTPVEVLARLASDVDAGVRLGVATNAHCCIEWF